MGAGAAARIKIFLALLLGVSSILSIGSRRGIEIALEPPQPLFETASNTIDRPTERSGIAADVISGSQCLNRRDIPVEDYHWLYIPNSSDELHTEVDYLFLAGQLIQYRVVDASDCPAAGLSENGYANACGMAKAREIVYQMQNLYDEEILAAWDTVGVPPVMLKQLIRYESQFWPSQYGMYHYGLGHVTYSGAHTALLWSPVLFEITCNRAYGEMCQGKVVDDVMVGTLLGMMNASCTSCEWGVDVPKAEESIYYIAHTLLAFCRQTSQIIYNATDRVSPSVNVDYATLWKLTLFNYNVGPTCLYEAVAETDSEIEEMFDFEDVAKYVYIDECERGIDYVNNITRRFYNFAP